MSIWGGGRPVWLPPFVIRVLSTPAIKVLLSAKADQCLSRGWRVALRPLHHTAAFCVLAAAAGPIRVANAHAETMVFPPSQRTALLRRSTILPSLVLAPR